MSYYYYICIESKLPFALLQVQLKTTDNNVIDITKQYVNTKKWKKSFSQNDLVYVTWKYINKEYKYVYKLSNPISFPPYTLEQLRQKPQKRIISLNYINDSQETINEITQYLGPLQNFYSDVCDNTMNLEWIINEPVEQLNIIDTTGTMSYIKADNLKI